MNITKNNFVKSLPYIRQVLNESDYIAIDFEFTGTTIDEHLKPNHDDCLETVHWKMASNSKFIPIKFSKISIKDSSNSTRHLWIQVWLT